MDASPSEDMAAVSPSASAPPSPRIRSTISLWLVIHLGLCLMSLASLTFANGALSRMVELASPYLLALRLHPPTVPLTADGGESLGALAPRIQWRPDAQHPWRPWSPPGVHRLEAERSERYLRTIAEAIQRQDTPTASMLVLPWVDTIMADAPKANPSEWGQPELRLVASGDPSPEVSVLWHVAIVPVGDASDTGAAPLAAQSLAARSLVPRSPSVWSVVTLEEPRLNARAATGEESESR